MSGRFRPQAAVQQLSDSHMLPKKLDHFVIRQLQLGNTAAITYRNMPHTITDEQRDINALAACACGYPNRVGCEDFAGTGKEEQGRHARIVAKDRRNERVFRVSTAYVSLHGGIGAVCGENWVL